MEYRSASMTWTFPPEPVTRSLDDVPRCRCLSCQAYVRIESLGDHKHPGQQVRFEYVGTKVEQRVSSRG